MCDCNVEKDGYNASPKKECPTKGTIPDVIVEYRCPLTTLYYYGTTCKQHKVIILLYYFPVRKVAVDGYV